MKKRLKLGLLLNFDFVKNDLTIIYNWFQLGMEENLERNTKTFYFTILFVGLTLRIEK